MARNRAEASVFLRRLSSSAANLAESSVGAGVSPGFAESVLRRLKGDSSSAGETVFKSNDRESGN